MRDRRRFVILRSSMRLKSQVSRLRDYPGYRETPTGDNYYQLASIARSTVAESAENECKSPFRAPRTFGLQKDNDGEEGAAPLGGSVSAGEGSRPLWSLPRFVCICLSVSVALCSCTGCLSIASRLGHALANDGGEHAERQTGRSASARKRDRDRARRERAWQTGWWLRT